MPKEYPTKFKTEVIQRYRNGESIQLLSQELHIAQSTIYHWRKEYSCPYCSGHKVLRGFNDLATLNPRLAKEWQSNTVFAAGR